MKISRSCPSLLLSALMVIVAVVPARAQQAAGDETVPMELFWVLVGGAGALPGTVDVLVGELPEAVARAVPLPEGARVVGSVAHPHRTRGVVAVPMESDAVLEQWRQRLTEAGWTRHERPSRGGFVSNWYPSRNLCMGDSTSLWLGAYDDPEGGSYVVVTYSSDGRGSPCGAAEAPGAWRQKSLIPALRPPAAAAVDGGRAGGGADEWSSQARVRSELTAEELADHYAAQLGDAGWVSRGAASGPDLVARTFRVTDEEGDAWHGVLLVSGPSAGLGRFLTVEVHRLGPPH